MRLPIQSFPVARMSQHSPRFDGSRAVNASINKCDVCTDVLAGVIYVAAKGSCWLGCWAVGTAVGIACDAAFGGPEDPVGDIVCPVAGAAVKAICNREGCSRMKTWSGAKSVAHQICSQVDLC